MINLNDNPEALLEAVHMDRFLLGGRELVLEETILFNGNGIYLTVANSPGFICPNLAKCLEESEDCDNPRYDTVWWHVRPASHGDAIRTREQMVSLIKSGEYEIG